ncbi:uncharacterized mitochondrial protein-like protein [Tanacetum coccineum]
MQMQEGKVDMGKALDAGLVVTKSSGTKSDKQDTSSRSENYTTHVVDGDIRPVNDQEPLVEVQLTAQNNVLANEQQHTKQSKPIHETYLLEKVDSNTNHDSTNMSNRGRDINQNAKKCQDTSPLLDTLTQPNTSEQSYQSLESENISLKRPLPDFKKLNKENEHLKQTYKDLYDPIKKKRVPTKDHNDSLIAQVNSKTIENANLKAQIQEKVFANAALKNELRKLKGNSVDTKFAKPSILGKPVLQPLKNQPVVRQPNAFQSERPKFSKPRFATQVDVNNDLPKPVTPHYLPKVKESVFILTGHRFSPNKSSDVDEKTSHRSCLRWKPTSRIFNTVSLRWVPTGKIFTSSTTKVASEPLNGSNEDITNLHECEQTCNVSAIPVVVALVPTNSTGSPSSAPVDQDAPSPNNDPFFGVSIPELNYEESSSRDVIPTIMPSVNQPPKHLSKWTKDHPLDNVIGIPHNPSLQDINYKTKPYQDDPYHVYKLKKALYELKQASRAWYDLLSSFLLSQKFSKGAVDPKLFTQKEGKDILLTTSSSIRNPLIAAQVAFDEALVSKNDRVVISKSDMRIDPSKTQKEATYQVILDTLKLSPCYNAFLIIADVPEI